MGVPHTDLAGVPPSGWKGYPSGLNGIPPIRAGWGNPTCQDWMGYPLLGLDGGASPPPNSVNRVKIFPSLILWMWAVINVPIALLFTVHVQSMTGDSLWSQVPFWGRGTLAKTGVPYPSPTPPSQDWSISPPPPRQGQVMPRAVLLLRFPAETLFFCQKKFKITTDVQ